MVCFTRHGLYPVWSPTPRRFRWSLTWGTARKTLAFGLSLRYGLTDGSGQFGRVDELALSLGPFRVTLMLWWGKRKPPPSFQLRSFSDLMREDPRHPIHDKRHDP